jgi:membrane protease YdiL (CAAX protease family)
MYIFDELLQSQKGHSSSPIKTSPPMEKKIFPNFSQALLYLIGYLVIVTVDGLVISGINDFIGMIGFNKTYSIKIITSYINISLLLWMALYMLKKTNNKISDYFSVPDILTIARFLIIILIFRLVISIPMDKPIHFFNFLHEYKLRLFNPSSDRPLSLFFDLLTIVIVPIVLEIFFRGLLLHQFLKLYSPIKAILLSSLLFGLYRMDAEHFVLLTSMGIILGIIYYKTNSLILVIVAHALQNYMSIFFTWKLVHLSTVHAVLFILVYIVSIWAMIYLIRKPLFRDNSMGIEDEM